jgi:hypothetical protein
MQVAAWPRPQREHRYTNHSPCRLQRLNYAVEHGGAGFCPNPLGASHPIPVIPDTRPATWRKAEQTTLRAELSVDMPTQAFTRVTIGAGDTAEKWWESQLLLHHHSKKDDERNLPGHYGSKATFPRWSWSEEPAGAAHDEELHAWPRAFTITSVQRKLVVTLAPGSQQVRRARVRADSVPGGAQLF